MACRFIIPVTHFFPLALCDCSFFFFFPFPCTSNFSAVVKDRINAIIAVYMALCCGKERNGNQTRGNVTHRDSELIKYPAELVVHTFPRQHAQQSSLNQFHLPSPSHESGLYTKSLYFTSYNTLSGKMALHQVQWRVREASRLFHFSKHIQFNTVVRQ